MSDEREFRLNWFDRMLCEVAPAYGLRRAAAKERVHRFGYDAANPGRFRKGSGGSSQNGHPENLVAQRETIDVMWAARAEEKKNALLVGMLDRIAMYVTGTLSYRSQTGDKTIDREYEDYLHEWCGRADVTRQWRFKHLVQQAFRGMLRDGDAGMVVERRGADWKLNVIEADRLGDPTAGTKNNERLYRGIHIDEDGAPVLYDIYKRTMMTQYKLEAQVPPERFIHLRDPMRTRPGQYRSVSQLAQALPKLQDLREIFFHEIIAHKNASAHAGFMRGGGGPGWDKEGDATAPPGSADGKPKYKIEPGKIVHLPDGETIEFPPALQRPSGAFMALVQSEIREVALSLKLPYGFLYDLTMLGGVTARIEVRGAERTIQYWQGLLEELVLNRVRDMVLESGIARGMIPPHKLWRRGRWNFGPFITADVGHEVNADLALLHAGVKTRTGIAEKLGDDISETAATLGREVNIFQEVAGETKVPIELMVSDMPNATQLLAAINTPPDAAEQEEEEAPPPGMIGTVGDKGVGPMVEILQSVSQGTMDREAAVLALVEIYGFDLAKAQMLVPVAPPAPAPIPNI